MPFEEVYVTYNERPCGVAWMRCDPRIIISVKTRWHESPWNPPSCSKRPIAPAASEAVLEVLFRSVFSYAVWLPPFPELFPFHGLFDFGGEPEMHGERPVE